MGTLMHQTKVQNQLFINGDFVDAAGGETFDKITPIDGTSQGAVASGQSADVDRAVAAAKTAFEDGRWSDLDPAERKRLQAELSALSCAQ